MKLNSRFAADDVLAQTDTLMVDPATTVNGVRVPTRMVSPALVDTTFADRVPSMNVVVSNDHVAPLVQNMVQSSPAGVEPVSKPGLG